MSEDRVPAATPDILTAVRSEVKPTYFCLGVCNPRHVEDTKKGEKKKVVLVDNRKYFITKRSL